MSRAVLVVDQMDKTQGQSMGFRIDQVVLASYRYTAVSEPVGLISI